MSERADDAFIFTIRVNCAWPLRAGLRNIQLENPVAVDPSPVRAPDPITRLSSKVMGPTRLLGRILAPSRTTPVPYPRMRSLLTSLLIFAVLTASAQELPKRTPERVFATYEDMVADKPVEGITIDYTSYKGFQKKGTIITLVENGVAREVNLNDVKYWGLTSSDGSIRRIFEGESFACWALGDKHCYYQGRRNYNMETGNYYMRDWVSAGPNAPIEEGKRLCEDIIEASEFKDAFKKAKPKREMKDSVDGYQEKQMMWYVDFINRINGESAVK